MDTNFTLSCDNFIHSSSSSSRTHLKNLCKKANGEDDSVKPSSSVSTGSKTCPNITSSSSSTMSLEFMQSDCKVPIPAQPQIPNIHYETQLAKSIMQECSTISGDNLFDHLSDIIKRVIDERPPNVIDFFEEFSRNVREQKFHLPERFPPDAVYEESLAFKQAKELLQSLKLPYRISSADRGAGDAGHEEFIEEEQKSLKTDHSQIALKSKYQTQFQIFKELFQHFQFYWSQCGLNFCQKDAFQLAAALNRFQNNPAIFQCRFWGIVNCLKGSYYIIETLLMPDEVEKRAYQMNEEAKEMEPLLKCKRDPKPFPLNIGTEFQLGSIGWENYPEAEVDKMHVSAPPMPVQKEMGQFFVPAEPAGTGSNRHTYFALNSLGEEWQELPYVTPQQITISRDIKKFFTGNLEAEIKSHPPFPGREKNYLRAIIARITSGTYIAPNGFYRKMSAKEKEQFGGMAEDITEEGNENEEKQLDAATSVTDSVGNEEEDDEDNDLVLLKNEDYKPWPLESLKLIENWVHTRANLLKQGRVVWFNEQLAIKEREEELKRFEERCRLAELEEDGEYNRTEDDEEEEDNATADDKSDVEEEDEEFIVDYQEVGPPLLSSCANDQYEDATKPWVIRQSSHFTNPKECVIFMRSNIWPGAFTFAYDKFCESIYMGWGHKYVARNMPWIHMPTIAEEYQHSPFDFIESTDPSVELEEAYRLQQLRKQMEMEKGGEEIDRDLNETSSDAEDDDDDDDDDDDE